mmetsp:Transcript_24211/g.22014  ORF Transcript_24211/g.22014 Transcript_24211/m.22014 type:complete len:253 (+) Transcript_24211:78-836(+)
MFNKEEKLCSILIIVLCLNMVQSFRNYNSVKLTAAKASSQRKYAMMLKSLQMAEEKKDEVEKTGVAKLLQLLEEADKEKDKKKTPIIYEPGPYTNHLLAAAAYIVPIVDASDIGKYMFEAYPDVGGVYNTVFGPIAAIYNGVPFLPFVIYFAMSYVCRAPSFPVEIRFHFSQAFILSIIQFLPVLLFGLLEKAGVPGMAVPYNTLFIWVLVSAILMQGMILNPFSSIKNPFLINIVGWSLRYMNFTKDMYPK